MPPNILCYLLFTGLLLSSCGQQPSELPRQPWIETAVDQWPSMLLTNHIELGGMVFHDKAAAFLIDAGSDTLAATCKHLFLAFETPQIQSIHFGDQLKRWLMYPRTGRGDTAAIGRLLNQDRTEKIIKQYIVNRDWLIFSMAHIPADTQPLKPRFGQLQEGEKIHLIGWTPTGLQQSFAGQIYKSLNNKYLVDFGAQDVAAFSAAPAIDKNGYLIGIHTGKIGQMSWVNSTYYLREILESR